MKYDRGLDLHRYTVANMLWNESLINNFIVRTYLWD